MGCPYHWAGWWNLELYWFRQNWTISCWQVWTSGHLWSEQSSWYARYFCCPNKCHLYPNNGETQLPCRLLYHHSWRRKLRPTSQCSTSFSSLHPCTFSCHRGLLRVHRLSGHFQPSSRTFQRWWSFLRHDPQVPKELPWGHRWALQWDKIITRPDEVLLLATNYRR